MLVSVSDVVTSVRSDYYLVGVMRFKSSSSVGYGKEMHVWSFSEKKYKYSIELGEAGLIPLEIRFLHDPEKAVGFVGCALSSTIYKFELNQVRLFPT